MTESVKTCVFVIVGAVALGLAWWARPAPFDRAAGLDDAGQRFFEQFDPLTARSMEILSVNPETVARSAFKVAQVDSKWAIPSRENYPADAQDRLAGAAVSVMDLIKGPSVSDSPADHELFGVVDPAGNGAASAGAGTRVTLQDEGNKTLVDLIIGKDVKDAEQVRYIRVPGRDRVYTAKVDTAQLSTKFEDWIERDLLKLEPSQIKEVFIEDYSIDELNGRVNVADHLKLSYEQAGDTWTLEGLAADETISKPRVDEMKAALDDLKIVDVHRKPAGLSAQLQSDKGLTLDPVAQGSLQTRGYFVVGGQLLSNEGETFVKMSDGVEYSLRFGEVVDYDEGSANLGADQSSEESGNKLGRYVFVTTSFDSGLIPPPELEDVPELPPATQPAEGDSSATQPTEDPARAAIIAANEQKQKDYDKKVADGQQRVRELNRRFADWYFVVSDATYQKLRLKRVDLVTKAGDPATMPAQPPTMPMSIPPAPPG
jgi:hypothetical protein